MDSGKFILLESSCPACPGDTKKRRWVHKGCNHPLELNCKGMLRCRLHRETISSVLVWKFACENHVGDFRVVDPLALAQAVTMMRSAAQSVEDRLWYASLALALSEMIQEQVKLENPGLDLYAEGC